MKTFYLALVALAFSGAALSTDKKDRLPAQSPTKIPASSAPAGTAASGAKVTVTYFPAESPASENGLLQLKEWNYLEAVSEAVQTGFRLPKPLSLVGRPCGEPNAFYVPDEKTIFICYELVDLIVGQADKAKGPDRRKKLPEESRALLAFGAVTFITLHEIGHALIDILDLPITGREEDVADQIATFLSLYDLKDEEDHEFALWTVVGGSWFFDMQDRQRLHGNLADEHSLDGQRVINVACWTYGSDPRRYAGLVPWFKGASDRLLRCETEHAQMHRALTKLIGPALLPQ